MKQALADLHAALGYKPLNRLWAKVEIGLGLFAAGVGMLFGAWAVSQPAVADHLLFALAGLCLFVLGGYLAMAGHRSHLYQSNNELAAYLADKLRRLNEVEG